MFTQGLLDYEADLGSHNAVSPNEARAVVKNRIEDKKLKSKFKYINLEAKFNFLNLFTSRTDAEKTSETIKNSTGYADCSKDFHAKDLEEFEKMNSVKFKNMKKHRSDSIDSSSSSFNEKRFVKFDDEDSDSSDGSSFDMRQSKLETRRVHSAFSMSRNEEYLNENFAKLKNQRLSLTINPKTKESIKSAMAVKKESFVKRTPNEIENLKKKDPVFAKRHKQFVNAKVCNKAPKFDHNDYLIKIVLPKAVLKRSQSNMMERVNDEQSDKPRILKAEMEKLDARVKQFVKEFST